MQYRILEISTLDGKAYSIAEFEQYEDAQAFLNYKQQQRLRVLYQMYVHQYRYEQQTDQVPTAVHVELYTKAQKEVLVWYYMDETQ